MTQTLLVTGGSGFIGSHVVESALLRGYRVRCIVRQESPGRDFLKALNVDLIIGDATDEAVIDQAYDGVDGVIHCAAVVGDWGDPEAFLQTNVDLLRKFALHPKARDLKKFIYLSSLGVYEPRHHYKTEESTPPAGRGLDAYTRSKIFCEVVMGEAIDQGVKGVLLRPGFVYGNRDRHVTPELARSLKKGLIPYFGSGGQILDHTYIENLVEAIFLALDSEKAVGQTYNVTDDPCVSRKNFFQTAALSLGVAPPKVHIPSFLAKPLTYFFEALAFVFRRDRPILLSRARYKFLYLNLDYSISKIKSELNYKPVVSFEKGLEKSMAWAKGLIQ